MSPVEERTIRIRLMDHDKTGLIMAISDDLPGLIVHGRTEQEVGEIIPGAIKDLYEAAGYHVLGVTAERDKRSIPNFGPPAYIANASLEAA